MNSKRGFIRILEAFIAVMLVAGVLLFLVQKQQTSSTQNDDKIDEIQKSILLEVSQEDMWRGEILQSNVVSEELLNFVNMSVPKNLRFDLKICNLEDFCPLDPYPQNKNVHSRSIAITVNLTEYNAKQLKIFMWER